MSVPVATAADAAALHRDLESAHYTVAALEETLGPVATAALGREQSVPALRVLRPLADPHAVLARVFLLGDTVARRQLEAALPTLGVTGAQRCGLVRAAGSGADDGVRAAVDLSPHAAADSAGEVAWWLASDVGELASGTVLPPDHVLGVGGASETLLQITTRAPVGRALDVGTGCGIQALHAARHAGDVVATDLSGRALAFARFNATLAGVTVDLRQGSLLAPVAGERFDLVVSNPPFVITPRRGDDARYTYRDGGRSGDGLVRDLVTGVGEVLAPGGVAQLLGNWEHHHGEDWRERVGDWLTAAGLDGWVVQRDVADPAEYAETWLRDGGLTPDRDPAAWRTRYEAWLDDFADRGVVGVGFGYVTLRRPRSGRVSLRRVEEQHGPVTQPLGPHLAAALRAHDWLAAVGVDGLARARLVVAEDVTEERHLVPGAADPSVIVLRQTAGFGRAVRVDTALAGLVGACDGDLSVGQILGGLAALLDVAADGLAASLLPRVADLVRDQVLVVDPATQV